MRETGGGVARAERAGDRLDPERLAVLVAGSGPRVPIRSPFDNQLIGEVPTSTAGDVTAAAAHARRAQLAWAATGIEQRAQLLLDFHDQLLDRLEVFADLIQSEAGKSRLSAVEEVMHVALTARYYGRTARRYLHSERGEGLFPMLTRVDRHYVPQGIVAVIAPWNYPLTMAVSDALPALVAGNAVICKPDAQTPFIALAAVELLRAGGLPADLFQIVNGPGPEVGPQLIAESDYVCFTGSTATGKKVAAQCAERLIGCSLELGGKNPLLVLSDADVEVAALGAVRACFANAGQLCVATERIYVAEPLLPGFCDALVTQTEALRLGSARDYANDMGCLINPAQVARVTQHVEDARSKGAQVLTGGRLRTELGALFYEPTVLTGVTAEMDCYAEETFGPVVSVYPVADDAQAIARANESPYGLNASVWTSDPARGRRVAAQITCGTVNVNEGFAATFGSIDAPMGGMKASGIGRRQGRDGIRRFVQVQSVATQSGFPVAPSHGLSAQRYAALMTIALRTLKKLGRA